MKVIKVGLLGMGTVGSGVFEVLKNNAAEISRRAGCTIQIGRVVVRDPEEVRTLVGPDIPLSSDPFDIVNDPAIDVLVEVMGGTTLARDVVLAAIAKGKQVVTANKALLAVHGNEIFARAREAGVMVAFEAAVAGGIPIVKALREGLPLRRAQWQEYLGWAVECFRITANGVADDTQIHTHMCYSEFNDIMPAIAAMDADVITIETSRSDMELLDAFDDFSYPNEIGPGVYDIHSPNVPTVQHMVDLMEKAAKRIPTERLWVNPDCGLKTRQWLEVLPALAGMVQAARQLREQHAS